jgi:hypothetical protein
MDNDSDKPVRPAFSELSKDLRASGPPGYVWLVAAGCLINFLLMPVLRGAEQAEGVWLLAAVGAGVLAGEFGLATLWLVWGPGSFGWRVFVHWTTALGLFVSWALGALASFTGAHNFPPNVPEGFTAILLTLPILSLAAQLPLWPLRTHLGWRLERQSAVNAAAGPHSLSIRDMILGTVATAVALACLRLMPTAVAGSGEGAWQVWGIAAAVTAVMSALSLLPATLMAFRIRETATAAISLAAYAAIAWVLTCVVGTVLGGPAPAEVYIAILVCYGSFTATVGLPLLILNSDGYTLTFASERQRRDV